MVEQQIAIILKHPSLSQRCNEIGNLIRERFACNMLRSILGQFKPIVENIFGYDTMPSQEFLVACESRADPSGGWMLKNLTRSSNSSDYNSVVSFLHPDGIFFALIKSLMAETSAKFEFPVSQFPPFFRSIIENGAAPPFFANKIISTSYLSASHLILNPFEFYIFHFGLYILQNSNSTFDTSGPNIDEPAYFYLLKTYLNYFVPLENCPSLADGNFNFSAPNSQQGSLWQSLSSTTTSILNLATNANQNSNNSVVQKDHIVPTLFKTSIFQPQVPFNQSSRSHYSSAPGPLIYGQGEHLGSSEWRCSTFLLMLTELWFGNIPSPKTNYILRSSNLDNLSISNIQPYSANVDQMTAVRLVIKHLHNFSNSFTYNPITHATSQGLAEIKQTIWTSKFPLQKRLYTFIKIAFSRWPMDYTFRQPLEAWLSYIQPWRYVKVGGDVCDYEELDGNKNATLVEAPSIDHHWKNFISDNLLYYTVIFDLLINRLLQLDLSSSRNALMLFRAIKVYSQSGFMSLLQEAEEAVLRSNFECSVNISSSKLSFKTSTPGKSADHNTSKAKLLAPSFLASGKVSTPKTKIGALEHHLMNLESDSDFHYVSLFSPHMKQQLSKLLGEVQKSRIAIKDFIQAVEVKSKLRSRSWVESIMSFLTMEDACFESHDERNMYKDKIQADEYLNFSMSKISQSFDIQIPDIEIQARNTTSTTKNPSNKIFFNF